MLIFNFNAQKTTSYVIGSEVKMEYDSIWSLHHGKDESSNKDVSIFVFKTSKFALTWNCETFAERLSTETLSNIAKSVVKRTKTLRYPSILRYIDSIETDEFIFLVVEPVEPLELYLSKFAKNNEQKYYAVSWGLYQIASAVTFLNKNCQSTHYNVCMSSVFVNQAGEWKLFGLECLTPSKERVPFHVFLPLSRCGRFQFDETRSQSIDIPTWIYDSWGLGHLIYQIFNGELYERSALQIPGKIPQNLASYYLELVCDDLKSRSSSLTFLEKASKGTGFFKNKFVDTMLFLGELQIKENEEKCKFFKDLTFNSDTFPQETCLHRILPELMNALEYGYAGSSVLSPIFKFGKLLNEDKFQNMIVPCILKMHAKETTAMVKLMQQNWNLKLKKRKQVESKEKQHQILN